MWSTNFSGGNTFFGESYEPRVFIKEDVVVGFRISPDPDVLGGCVAKRVGQPHLFFPTWPTVVRGEYDHSAASEFEAASTNQRFIDRLLGPDDTAALQAFLSCVALLHNLDRLLAEEERARPLREKAAAVAKKHAEEEAARKAEEERARAERFAAARARQAEELRLFRQAALLWPFCYRYTDGDTEPTKVETAYPAIRAWHGGRDIVARDEDEPNLYQPGFWFESNGLQHFHPGESVESSPAENLEIYRNLSDWPGYAEGLAAARDQFRKHYAEFLHGALPDTEIARLLDARGL